MSKVCEYCHHEFTSTSNLFNHQRSAKYCLELRNQAKPNGHKCEACGKEFTQLVNLNKHLEKCVETLQQRIKDQKSEIDSLRSRIVEMEKEVEVYKGKIVVYKERPGAVYVNPKILNVKCDTIPPLTVETVKQEIESGSYSYEMYIRGERGLVDFIASIIKSEDDQRSYVCTDAARNKFHRLIETREWKEDNGANFLNKIFDQLGSSATDYYHKINNMTLDVEDRDTGEFLMSKTKRMFFGITRPKSKDRTELFNKIRTEVRTLASV